MGEQDWTDKPLVRERLQSLNIPTAGYTPRKRSVSDLVIRFQERQQQQKPGKKKVVPDIGQFFTPSMEASSSSQSAPLLATADLSDSQSNLMPCIVIKEVTDRIAGADETRGKICLVHLKSTAFENT